MFLYKLGIWIDMYLRILYEVCGKDWLKNV